MSNLPRRKRRPDQPDRADDTPTSYADQVSLLLELAEQAVALQSAADAAIRSCGAAGTIPDEVAVRTGRLLRGYSRLHHQLDDLTADPDLAQVRLDLLSQVSYHLHMLRDAGDLVFSGHATAETDRFRRELAEGLGSHAAGLLSLRDALTARRAALS
jgi:hypothetical protein